MKKHVYILFAVCFCLLLTGCVSGRRMVRNSPFDGGKFYRDGVNLFPLYYQEGGNRSILFPLIDMDDRGFAVRPFYHKDKDDHGILWPLCAFNSKGGWAGPFYWKNADNVFSDSRFGLLPLFIKDDERTWIFPASWYGKDSYGILPLFAKNEKFLWVFPASWYSERSKAILPFYCQNEEFLWIGNVFKSHNMFLVFPFYGKGNSWTYVLNFIYDSNEETKKKEYVFFPIAYFEVAEKAKRKNLLLLPVGWFATAPDAKEVISPLCSFSYIDGQLKMLNIALFYHYTDGRHYVFYPFANAEFTEESQACWLWPLFNYGIHTRNSAPLFLFDYERDDNHYFQNYYQINILEPLLFQYKNSAGQSEIKILPWGLLWRSKSSPRQSEYRILGGSLWYSDRDNEYFEQRILGGAIYRNSKDAESRRFSLLYKFFSYHRFKNDVKWEFFPFVKIMETANGDSWSFCWRFLEKHDGGGHIFFIPWGKETK